LVFLRLARLLIAKRQNKTLKIFANFGGAKNAPGKSRAHFKPYCEGLL